MPPVHRDAVGCHDVFDLRGDHTASCLDAQHILMKGNGDSGGGGEGK